MNILFLIGNGFDINLGLKTRYENFYDYFQKHASKNNIINQWMEADANKGDWSDLELALGEKVQSIEENAVEAFMDAHTELDSLLLEYLEEEQKKYSVEKSKDVITRELVRSLKELPSEYSEEEQRSYKTTFDASKNEDLQYSFITFNYTDVLDQIIETAKGNGIDLGSHTGTNGQARKHLLGEVHHVHGTLAEGVVLGVNDETQINNELLKKHTMFKNIFLKSRINRQMGQRRTERAEEMIDRSQIICIFGMSLGVTDKKWWEKIVSWIMSNEHRKLIIYARGDEALFRRKIPTQVIREREKVRRDFWEKGKGKQDESAYEKLSQRVFVVFNSKIFSFPRVPSS